MRRDAIGTDDIERAAALLDAHADYRVLRALPPPDRLVRPDPIGHVRTAAIVDVETCGLASDDPIIDLAVQRIAFDAHGRIVGIGRMRQWFEDPGRSIPPAITRLTGIADADVAGRRIDDAEALAVIAGSDVAIAHNAAFDAPRIERRLPGIAGHAWACSCSEVAWQDAGYDGRKLGHLLMQSGLFHQGHRAAADVAATIALLACALPDGGTVLGELVHRAEVPTIRIEANEAPFSVKDALKARGYRWNGERRLWWTELPVDGEAEERQWLADACRCERPTIRTITWRQRHR